MVISLEYHFISWHTTLMIGHQRNIMAQLGIDLWVPRAAAYEKVSPRSIWREQDQPESHQLPPNQIASQTSNPVLVTEESAHSRTEMDLDVAQQNVSSKQESIEQSLPTAAAFQLQALMLPEYTLVVDALHLDSAQRQLWNNIKDALGAEYLSIDWPLSFEHFQNPKAQHIYLKGFFDMITDQKMCLCLGELPYSPAGAMLLPSLAVMLEQPLLKQQLWQHIQRIRYEKSGGV